MNTTTIPTTIRHKSAAVPLPGGATPKPRVSRKAPVRAKTSLLEAHKQSADLQSVRLTYYHPTAGEVYVAGVFNNWNPAATPMLRQPDGSWIADLILAPGVYEYRFFADGQWRDDPKAAAMTPNPFGGVNAVLQVERL